MLDNEIRELAAIGETEEIEFKVGSVHPQALSRVVSAFANGIGGKILVGVDEKNGIVGCDRDKLRRVFEATQRQIKGSVDISLDFASVGAKEVGVISVGKSDDVVMSRDGIFIRRGATDIAMTSAEIRKRLSPEPAAATERLIDVVTEQTKRIEELQDDIQKGGSWQSKALDYIIGGSVGAIIGFGLTLALK
ncbi:MAG: AlbA family DNA-binding domain-containing protein [Thermodesulfobacteriota bacterium]